MPKKAKKVKKDVKQRATNIININLDGKTKTKQRRTKKASTDVKGVKTLKYDTDYLKKNGQGLISGYTPPSLFNPLRPAYNVITQAAPTTQPTPKSNDWEDALKKLIEMQTNQLKQAMVTPGKTPDATPTPKPVSSSSTPGHTIRLPTTNPKQSVLQSVKKTDLSKPSSRVVSDAESSDYANPFDSFQKTINQAFVPPDSFYETDIEDAINKQMPPSSKAASASSSILDLAKQNQQIAVQNVAAKLAPVQEQAPISNVVNDIQQQQVAAVANQIKPQDEQKYGNDSDIVAGNAQKAQEPAGPKGYWIPEQKLWSTGVKYTDVITNPTGKVQQKIQAGQKDVINVYEVATRQDNSIWVKDENGQWKSESSAFKKDTPQRSRWLKWKQANPHIFVFPQDKVEPVVEKAGRKAVIGF